MCAPDDDAGRLEGRDKLFPYDLADTTSVPTNGVDIVMIDTTPGTANPRVTLCSTVSEASGEDPAGSAWSVRRILMMELALPWAYNVLESKRAPAGLHDLLHEVYDTLDEPWGMIGMAPDPDYSIDGMTRIVDLQQGDHVASTYRRDTYLVPADEVVDYLRTLSFEPDHPRLAEVRLPDDQETREFFVCTHGAIDACCATFGYPMYKLMRAMANRAETPTRVWRCTHFGGHRFAATALETPAGRYWGHLKAERLATLVHRTNPARELRRHYRGWAALSQPMWQIAEAALLEAAGWSWTDATITAIDGEVTPDAGGMLTIAFRHPALGDGEADVEIAPAGSVQTMDQSKTGELRDAPQFATRIAGQRPPGCLGGTVTR